MNPPELKSNKSQQLYNKFIDFVVATNPQRYYQDDFVKLTSDEVEEAFCYTIFRIFGDTEEIRSLVAAFGSKVRVSNDREILSGATVTVLDKRTGVTEQILEVPSICNTSSVVSLAHEFIHFYMSSKYAYNQQIDLNKKFYYTEILSIFAEKVATEFVKAHFGYQQDMSEKIENTRLDGLVWHYTKCKEEIEELQKIYNEGKRSKNVRQDSIAQLEKQFPWLMGGKDRTAYMAYKDNLAYSYGFGYIYGESIYKRFMDDFEKTGYDIRQLFDGKISMDDLLVRYGIGMNQPTITVAKQKVKSVLKK